MANCMKLFIFSMIFQYQIKIIAVSTIIYDLQFIWPLIFPTDCISKTSDEKCFSYLNMEIKMIK